MWAKNWKTKYPLDAISEGIVYQIQSDQRKIYTLSLTNFNLHSTITERFV